MREARVNLEVTRSGPQECPHLVAVGGTFKRTQQGQIRKGKAMSQSCMGGAWGQDSNSPIPAHGTGSPVGHVAGPAPRHSHGWAQVMLGATSQVHPALVPQEEDAPCVCSP